jgi:cell division protein FtsW
MPRKVQFDGWLFGATVALCLAGAVMVFSASAMTARETFGSAYAFVGRQLVWLAIGLAGMFLLMHTDYRRLRQPVVIYSALAAVLALLIAVFFFDRVNGTHRWMRIGWFNLQPAELAKLVVILYLAWLLEIRRRPRGAGVNHLRLTLLPALGPVLVMAGLVLAQPDFGTAVELLLIAAAILFVAGLEMRWLAYAAPAALVAFYLAVVRTPYRYNRVITFLNPEADPQGGGFQLLQSLIAIGSGGLAGVGLMESRQKLFYLPEAHTDFIFAVLCEEVGFLGGLAVLALFGIYGWRGLRAAWAAPDDFGRLAAVGITVMIVGQALINLSVVLGLMPTKGIPLPFVSYGGASLIVSLLATGVLLNISQHAD